jgi:hypothetical protein
MFAGMVEVQDKEAFARSDIADSIPDPLGSIGQHHGENLFGIAYTAGKLDMNPLEELIGVFNPADMA